MKNEVIDIKEFKGNIWDYSSNPNVFICITTNGTIKINGACVMGRGNALEASVLYPGISKILGSLIKSNGNIVQPILKNIIAFPVKHNWYENADISLIIKSANVLANIANENKDKIYILPRPGCGNGKLKWNDVKTYIIDILPDNVIIMTY